MALKLFDRVDAIKKSVAAYDASSSRRRAAELVWALERPRLD
jgi:hypothetical protein